MEREGTRGESLTKLENPLYGKPCRGFESLSLRQ